MQRIQRIMSFCTHEINAIRIIVLTVAATATGCLAQTPTSRPPLQAQVEVGGWVSAAQTQPFWLRANQWGIIPRSTPAVTGRAGIWKDYVSSGSDDTLTKRPRRWGWGFGVNAVMNAGSRTQILLPEAYVRAKYGGLELSVGRRRELIGLGDSTLSSGFVVGSGNALPIPKVQLATRGYLPFGFLKSWIAVNAGYAHGWFNVPYIQDSYLHQKYLYLRFGKPTGRVRVHLGLNHQVQWAGNADYLKELPDRAIDGKLPSSVRHYGTMILAQYPAYWQGNDYTSFDGAYRIGNHVGSADGGIEVSAGGGNWFLYHQHVYDDLSGLLFVNGFDGLTGLRWARNARQQSTRSAAGLQRVVLEHLRTTNQSGPTFDVPNSSYQGGDNYFNHGQYREGWSYLGRSLGTPFIAPASELRPNAQTALFFSNNRVRAWYIGAAGWVSNRFTWTTRLAYSQNYGTFFGPYAQPREQVSALLTGQMPLQRWPGTALTGSIAFDRGRLLPNTVGGYVGLAKRW